MRLVFMGTPSIATPVLGRLAAEHEVAAVYTQPDAAAGRGREAAVSAVKQEAVRLGLEIVQPAGFKSRETVELLKGLKPEAVLVVAYGRILPPEVLEIPPLGCINVHFSLLPRHRGASPVAGAILAGDVFTGISIMLMDRGMDTGPVLAEYQLPIFDWDTARSLGLRLSEVAPGAVIEVLRLWKNGSIKPVPQDSSQATYSGMITKNAGFVDWNESAESIWRKARAYHPWPGIHTVWKGKVLKLIEVKPLQITGAGLPGRVIELAGNQAARIGVITGKGVLAVSTLQLEGRKAVSSAEFYRGQRDITGSVLPN
ncbi:MAG: methionyl-tRNA formyltransferase [Dehalococcoidaceae bacterium]|nr:methionyl-tRNA formyltransferase [Dehalococcoidaceae bacterium]